MTIRTSQFGDKENSIFKNKNLKDDTTDNVPKHSTDVKENKHQKIYNNSHAGFMTSLDSLPVLSGHSVNKKTFFSKVSADIRDTLISLLKNKFEKFFENIISIGSLRPVAIAPTGILENLSGKALDVLVHRMIDYSSGARVSPNKSQFNHEHLNKLIVCLGNGAQAMTHRFSQYNMDILASDATALMNQDRIYSGLRRISAKAEIELAGRIAKNYFCILPKFNNSLLVHSALQRDAVDQARELPSIAPVNRYHQATGLWQAAKKPLSSSHAGAETAVNHEPPNNNNNMPSQLQIQRALDGILNRQVRLPPVGPTAFDPRLTPAWAGLKLPQ